MRSHHRGLLASCEANVLAAALSLSLPLVAQDRAAAVATITKEYEQANQEWSKRYAAAKEEERYALYERRPQPEHWFPRLWEIIDSAAKDDAAAQAAMWIVAFASPATPDLERAIGVLKAHHLRRPELVGVCGVLASVPTAAAEEFLRQLEITSRQVEVKARACFSRADLLKEKAEIALLARTADQERLAALVEHLGQPIVDELKVADIDKLEQRAAKLFEKVAKTTKYRRIDHIRGDLGAAAESCLYELRHLTIGKTAPEIVGTDLDGEPMKLSDYRGSVVVLNFWGDW